MYYTELNGNIVEINALSANAVSDAVEDVLESTQESTKNPPKKFPDGQSNAENALDTLEYMGKGMFGIFVVTAIIILSVFLLNKFTSKKN